MPIFLCFLRSRQRALASEEELAAGLSGLRARIEAGTAAGWLEEREATRAAVGQTTTVVATKPLA
jgi:hypothetical protein